MTEEQNDILDRVRAYASDYIQKLPNFVCLQVTRQFVTEGRDRKFKPIGEYHQKLNYVEGHETYEDVPTVTLGKQHEARSDFHAYSRGEFGSLMRQVLVADRASFTWLSWDSVDGFRAAVFAYHVDLAHSGMVISVNSDKVVSPYHGLVFADPAGTVLRITSEAEDIPSRFAFQQAGNDVTYGPVAISGTRYLLPTVSIFSGVSRTGLFRNEARFTDYQKFGAESQLKYEPQ